MTHTLEQDRNRHLGRPNFCRAGRSFGALPRCTLHEGRWSGRLSPMFFSFPWLPMSSRLGALGELLRRRQPAGLGGARQQRVRGRRPEGSGGGQRADSLPALPVLPLGFPLQDRRGREFPRSLPSLPLATVPKAGRGFWSLSICSTGSGKFSPGPGTVSAVCLQMVCLKTVINKKQQNLLKRKNQDFGRLYNLKICTHRKWLNTCLSGLPGVLQMRI